jgi:hypothetical protein
MSARRTAVSASVPTVADVLDAMLRTDDGVDDFRGNLAVANQHLPAFLQNEYGFNDSAVQEAADRLLQESMPDRDWLEALALVDRIVEAGVEVTLTRDDVAMVGRYRYTVAGGAFALGFAAGMKMGGAR